MEMLELSDDMIWNKIFNIMRSPEVAEVVANGPNQFFVTRNGKSYKIDFPTMSERAYKESIVNGLVPLMESSRSYEQAKFIHEGKLVMNKAGVYFEGRCHIAIAPIADLPQVTLTRKSVSLATIDDLAAKGSMSTEMMNFIKSAVDANLTIVLSGKTGAGKALHKDTKIPTISGFKTVEEIEVGETFFDEQGDKCQVKRKYCPQDPKSFELEFCNGQKIKASSGHLWTVHNRSRNIVETLTTLELANNPHNYFIRKVARVKAEELEAFYMDPEIGKHYHEIVAINEINDDSDDYYCFQVDSPSHLFLCTESFIPTHNTTMLESLTRLWPADVRVGLAEDLPELNIPLANVSPLHTTPYTPDMDPAEVAELPYVVRQWQRQRLTKAIIGETRGGEFSEFLVAANSGLEGSLTTLHANDPVMALDKMTRFALKGSPNQPIRSINMEIGASIDLIIQLGKINGRHRITHIAEVTSTVSDDDTAKLSSASIYEFNRLSQKFEKTNTLTDNLRKKFVEAEVDLRAFSSTPVGTIMEEHNPMSSGTPQNIGGGLASPTQNNRPTRGLPNGGRAI